MFEPNKSDDTLCHGTVLGSRHFGHLTGKGPIAALGRTMQHWELMVRDHMVKQMVLVRRVVAMPLYKQVSGIHSGGSTGEAGSTGS